MLYIYKLIFCLVLFNTEVPAPIIIWDPVYLDWEKINSNLIDEIQFSATNKGFIATDNLTWSIPDVWRDTAFIAPKERNLGRLNANTTLTFPVKLEQIIRWNVPSDRFEMRSDENPNTVIFLPDINDTARWENGPDYIAIDADDSLSQWYWKFHAQGHPLFSFCYKNFTRYDYIYDGTFDENGTAVLSNITITSDANLALSRRLSSDIPPTYRANSIRAVL